MDKWEYQSIFLEADAKDKQIRQYIEENFSKKAKRYSPEALIPELNKLGADGWELIHMEPIPKIGRNDKVQLDPYRWSNTYFCVFKRQVGGIEAQATPVLQAQSAQSSESEVQTPPIELDPNRIPY